MGRVEAKIPEYLHNLLREYVAKVNGATISGEVKAALERHLRDHGVQPKMVYVIDEMPAMDPKLMKAADDLMTEIRDRSGSGKPPLRVMSNPHEPSFPGVLYVLDGSKPHPQFGCAFVPIGVDLMDDLKAHVDRGREGTTLTDEVRRAIRWYIDFYRRNRISKEVLGEVDRLNNFDDTITISMDKNISGAGMNNSHAKKQKTWMLIKKGLVTIFSGPITILIVLGIRSFAEMLGYAPGPVEIKNVAIAMMIGTIIYWIMDTRNK